MTIPSGGFSSTPLSSPLLSPDSFPRLDTRVDFERGGVALNDPTQGYNIRDWQAGTDGIDVWVCPYPEQTPRTVYYTGNEITEVTLAFDQNMAPTLAWVENGLVKLRWFDSTVSTWAVTSFAGARSPMLTLDDKRPIANASNDIIFAYIRAGNVCYREQRTRFNPEIVLGPVPGASARLIQLGMGTNLRLQFKVAYVAAGVHVERSSGDMFVIDGTEVVKVEGGAVQEATWRSRVFVFDAQPSFAWARVEADGPVTVRVYADGALLITKPGVASNVPFRLPPKKAREWCIEVAGTERVVAMAMASSVAELER